MKVFQQEWDGKMTQVGSAIPAAELNKADNWNGDDYNGPALGTYLKGGWKPDFTPNAKNAAWINNAAAPHLHNGKYLADVEGLGLGPTTRLVVNEVLAAYTNYFNAYYNTDADASLPEPQRNTYLMYSNFFRLNLEVLLDRIPEILTVRSKELTQSPNVVFEDSQHEDILDQIRKSWAALLSDR